MNLNPVNQLTLYGYHSEFSNFIKLYKSEKLPNKILLSGQKGIGKSTLAYHIINHILSINEDFSYDTKNFKINPDNKSFNKKIILIDRFTDSTIAYQHYGMGIDLNLIKTLNKYLLQNIKVSFTFLNIVNKKNLQKRLKKRKTLNRYDKFKISFYNRVQKGFIKLSKEQKNKYQLINSNLEIKKNEKLLLSKIDKLIK